MRYTLLNFRNTDYTKDINIKFSSIFNKGVLSGGYVERENNSQIRITPAHIISSDGLYGYSDTVEIFDVTQGNINYVIAVLKYKDDREAEFWFECMPETQYISLSDNDKEKRILLACVDLLVPNVTEDKIGYIKNFGFNSNVTSFPGRDRFSINNSMDIESITALNGRYLQLGSLLLRGVVKTADDLENEDLVKRSQDGDVYIVMNELNENPDIYIFKGGVYYSTVSRELEFTKHRQNRYNDAHSGEIVPFPPYVNASGVSYEDGEAHVTQNHKIGLLANPRGFTSENWVADKRYVDLIASGMDLQESIRSMAQSDPTVIPAPPITNGDGFLVKPVNSAVHYPNPDCFALKEWKSREGEIARWERIGKTNIPSDGYGWTFLNPKARTRSKYVGFIKLNSFTQTSPHGVSPYSYEIVVDRTKCGDISLFGILFNDEVIISDGVLDLNFYEEDYTGSTDKLPTNFTVTSISGNDTINVKHNTDYLAVSFAFNPIIDVRELYIDPANPDKATVTYVEDISTDYMELPTEYITGQPKTIYNTWFRKETKTLAYAAESEIQDLSATTKSAGTNDTVVRGNHVHKHGTISSVDGSSVVLHSKASGSLPGFLEAPVADPLNKKVLTSTVLGVQAWENQSTAFNKNFSASVGGSDGVQDVGATTPSSVGTSTQVAKADHIHFHGTQTLGNLHAVVNNLNNGFVVNTFMPVTNPDSTLGVISINGVYYLGNPSLDPYVLSSSASLWTVGQIDITGVILTNGGGGYILATKTAHGLTNGQVIYIPSGSLYQGYRVIEYLSSSTFKFSASFLGNETVDIQVQRYSNLRFGNYTSPNEKNGFSAGKSYKMIFKAKVHRSTAEQDVKFAFTTVADGNESYLGYLVNETTPAWHNYSYTFTVPFTMATSFYINIVRESGAFSSYVYFDDMYIYELAALEPKNNIVEWKNNRDLMANYQQQGIVAKTINMHINNPDSSTYTDVIKINNTATLFSAISYGLTGTTSQLYTPGRNGYVELGINTVGQYNGFVIGNSYKLFISAYKGVSGDTARVILNYGISTEIINITGYGGTPSLQYLTFTIPLAATKFYVMLDNRDVGSGGAGTGNVYLEVLKLYITENQVLVTSAENSEWESQNTAFNKDFEATTMTDVSASSTVGGSGKVADAAHTHLGVKSVSSGNTSLVVAGTAPNNTLTVQVATATSSDVSASSNKGSGPRLAFEDHTHLGVKSVSSGNTSLVVAGTAPNNTLTVQTATTAPPAISSAVIGSGPRLAFEDHTHSHGNQTGSANHSEVDIYRNGFVPILLYPIVNNHNSFSDVIKINGNSNAVGATYTKVLDTDGEYRSFANGLGAAVTAYVTLGNTGTLNGFIPGKTYKFEFEARCYDANNVKFSLYNQTAQLSPQYDITGTTLTKYTITHICQVGFTAFYVRLYAASGTAQVYINNFTITATDEGVLVGKSDATIMSGWGETNSAFNRNFVDIIGGTSGIQPVNFSATSAGTSDLVARSNHQHLLPADITVDSIEERTSGQGVDLKSLLYTKSNLQQETLLLKINDVGKNSVLAWSSTNSRWHLLYIDVTNNNSLFFKYSTDGTVGANWSNPELVAPAVAVRNPAMCIDTAGVTHISYQDITASSYKLWYNNRAAGAGTWGTAANPTGVTGTNVGEYSAIASFGSTVVYLCFYGASKNLNVIKRTSGSWGVISTIDNIGGDVGSYCSIATDSSGNAHISYYDATNDKVKYAHNVNSGSWTLVDAAGTTNKGTYTSIQVTNSNIYISFYNINDSALGFAGAVYPTGPGWTPVFTETSFDTTNSIGTFTSMKIDTTTGFISYYDDTSDNLKIASFTLGTTSPYYSNLSINIVDSIDAVGTYSSLAINNTTGGSGDIAIAYYDATNKVSKFAYKTKTGSAWNFSNPSLGYGDNGYNLSSCIDSFGKIHICYYGLELGNSNKILKYSTNKTGKWETTNLQTGITADIGSPFYYNTAITTDINNNVHIIFSYTNAAIGYATNMSGNWGITTNKIIGLTSPSNFSICVDSSLSVYVNYNNTNGYYAYKNWAANGTQPVGVAKASDTPPYYKACSMLIDCDSTLHLCYYDGYNSPYGLKYRSKLISDSSWSSIVPVIDYNCSDNTNSRPIIIAKDSVNRLYVIFGGNSTTDYYLRMVTNMSGSWVASQVSESITNVYFTNYGSGNILATCGNVNTSYKKHKLVTGAKITIAGTSDYDGIGIDVTYVDDYSFYFADTYTVNKIGSITITPTGFSSSLSIDANDRIHVSSFDDYCDSFVYATKLVSDLNWVISYIATDLANNTTEIIGDGCSNAHYFNTNTYNTSYKQINYNYLKFAVEIDSVYIKSFYDSIANTNKAGVVPQTGVSGYGRIVQTDAVGNAAWAYQSERVLDVVSFKYTFSAAGTDDGKGDLCILFNSYGIFYTLSATAWTTGFVTVRNKTAKYVRSFTPGSLAGYSNYTQISNIGLTSRSHYKVGIMIDAPEGDAIFSSPLHTMNTNVTSVWGYVSRCSETLTTIYNMDDSSAIVNGTYFHEYYNHISMLPLTYVGGSVGNTFREYVSSSEAGYNLNSFVLVKNTYAGSKECNFVITLIKTLV